MQFKCDIHKIKREKWKWAGHLARIEENRWTYKLTFCFLQHNKRKTGKQNVRWMNEIENFIHKQNVA